MTQPRNGAASGHLPAGSVSVVIPCYNAERWIGRSVGSIIDQGKAVSEVVVIDDGSSDRSLEIVRSFGPAVTWRTGPHTDGCVGRVRNRGLESANGEFVMFLDADDYVERGSIAEWAAVAGDADLVLGPFAYETGGTRVAARRLGVPSPGPDAVLAEWLAGWFTPPCAVLWRRSFLHRIGAWNAELPRNEDGEVVVRGLLYGARVAAAQRGLGIYVQHQQTGRVSKRCSRTVLAADLASFENLWALAVAQGRSHLRGSFARSFYRIAYESWANGVDDVGRAAFVRARELGLKGHVGSPVHRILAGTLGLRNKLLLTGMLKGRRSMASAGRGAPLP